MGNFPVDFPWISFLPLHPFIPHSPSPHPPCSHPTPCIISLLPFFPRIFPPAPVSPPMGSICAPSPPPPPPPPAPPPASAPTSSPASTARGLVANHALALLPSLHHFKPTLVLRCA
ncbi:unnamed protein product [Closterium sp. NIES-54]